MSGDYLDPPKANKSVPGEWPPVRLRQLLRFLRFTYQELADALGLVNRRALSNWINQGKKPRAGSRKLLDRLAEARGFFLAEKRAKKQSRHLPATAFGESAKHTRRTRRRQAVGGTDGE